MWGGAVLGRPADLLFARYAAPRGGRLGTLQEAAEYVRFLQVSYVLYESGFPLSPLDCTWYCTGTWYYPIERERERERERGREGGRGRKRERERERQRQRQREVGLSL